MENSKSYQLTPEQAEVLKAKLGACAWTKTGECLHALVFVQGVNLALYYTPPNLFVEVLKKPWYAPYKKVWEKIDEYINLNQKENNT